LSRAPDWRGVALIAVSAASFATLGVFGKLAYAEGLDLPSSLFWRFSGAALALGLWLALAHGGRITPRGAVLAFLLGAIGYAIQATLFFGALQYAGASVVVLLLYLYPAFVVLLAWLVERDRPDRLRLTALAAALAGCALTADLAGGQIAALGVILGVGSAVWYSLYLTFGARLVRAHDPVATTALICTGAAISFALAATVSGGLMTPATLPGWAALAGMAVIATALAIGALFAGIARLGTPTAAILSTLEPVIAVALGIALLGEALTPRQVAGAALVLAAALALQRRAAAPSTPPTPAE
jgi:drug/metabolite transporter (DMT)-like permease